MQRKGGDGTGAHRMARISDQNHLPFTPARQLIMRMKNPFHDITFRDVKNQSLDEGIPVAIGIEYCKFGNDVVPRIIPLGTTRRTWALGVDKDLFNRLISLSFSCEQKGRRRPLTILKTR